MKPNLASTAQSVKLLATQIPSFGGTQDEDVEFVKNARDWLDLDNGLVNRSYSSLRIEISNAVIEISAINGSNCSLNALIDTGSPISFISCSTLLLHLMFLIVHVDHMGPLPEASDHSKHILTLIDACTRFI
ncbi:hypothetical protein ALC57_15636 [Trachymyrmex cornetzi]|uniref:Uncharacterized protein n=1 Tax=Trachymyrmex cornetzi TaxID=471704 RepID=A0A151IWK7_9HYME|nr:hypothetical protein ALC57_15636 [Trachymyrmex cornetzi]